MEEIGELDKHGIRELCTHKKQQTQNTKEQEQKKPINAATRVRDKTVAFPVGAIKYTHLMESI